MTTVKIPVEDGTSLPAYLARPAGDQARTGVIVAHELFGVNPFTAGVASDPGSYNVFNGAETKFDDAYNVLLYAAENQNALIPAGDLFGNHISDALAGGTDASAFEYLWNFGVGDLSGFFQENLSFLDITTASATSLFSLFG